MNYMKIVPDFQKQERNHNPFLVIDPANHESKYYTCHGAIETS